MIIQRLKQYVEKNMFRKIFGALYNIESKEYAIRHNTIVQNIYRRYNTQLFNGSRQIEWFRDVRRINSKTMKRVKKKKVQAKDT